MKRIELNVGEFPIYAKIIKTGKDYVVIVGGGESHIGAVSVSFIVNSIITGQPTVTTSVITLPSHKEDIVARSFSIKLAEALQTKVTVIAGIHYDNINKKDIDNILKSCDILVKKILKTIKEWKDVKKIVSKK